VQQPAAANPTPSPSPAPAAAPQAVAASGSTPAPAAAAAPAVAADAPAEATTTTGAATDTGAHLTDAFASPARLPAAAVSTSRATNGALPIALVVAFAVVATAGAVIGIRRRAA
jgi:hypothetical protein